MIDIDLLAPVQPERPTVWARAWARLSAHSAWLIALVTVVALLCGHVALGRAERRLDAALARARVAASRVARRAERVRLLEEQEARLRSTELALRSAQRRARTGVARLLASLSGALPKDVWLDRLDVRRAEITIQGRGRSLSSLVVLARELSALPVFDGPTDLSEVGHGRGATARADGTAFTFTLRGRLRPSTSASLRRDRVEAPARSTRP